MVYRFKFRIRGPESPGKFVFTLEEGKEIFLDMTFQPSAVHTAQTCLFLEAHQGKALLHFIGQGLRWNGKTAPKGPVELHPGHLIQLDSQSVEILECPEIPSPKGLDRTTFLDLSSLGPREHTRVPASRSSPEQPAPELEEQPPPTNKPIFQPMPEGSLNSPDSVAQPEPGDTFDPDSWQSPSAASALALAPAALLDPKRKVPNSVAFGILALTLGIAALALPRLPLLKSRWRGAGTGGPPQQEIAPHAAAAASREANPSPSVRVVAVPPLPGAMGNTSSREVFAFLEAVRGNDLPAVRSAIEGGKLSQDFTFDEAGRAPLARAASFGHTGLVRYFHSRNADLNALDYSGNSALMWAVANTQEDAVKALLSLGADPLPKRRDGLDAMSLARQTGNLRIQQAVENAVQDWNSKTQQRVPASEQDTSHRNE